MELDVYIINGRGEKGDKLSGGQKQRIAIARAIYKNCELLIFDEATNSLDPKTENLIVDNTKVLKDNGITIIMVTHKMNSLKYCDLIYKMEKGKITKQLSFQESLANEI